MENIPITPSQNDPENLKFIQGVKKSIEEMRLEAEGDLSQIEALIQETEKEIAEQKEYIAFMRDDGTDLDQKTLDIIKKAEEMLASYEQDLKDTLSIRKRVLDCISDTMITDAHFSGLLEDVEGKIQSFKENLLNRPPHENN